MAPAWDSVPSQQVEHSLGMTYIRALPRDCKVLSQLKLCMEMSTGSLKARARTCRKENKPSCPLVSSYMGAVRRLCEGLRVGRERKERWREVEWAERREES